MASFTVSIEINNEFHYDNCVLNFETDQWNIRTSDNIQFLIDTEEVVVKIDGFPTEFVGVVIGGYTIKGKGYPNFS